jgi:hypothetical protein
MGDSVAENVHGFVSNGLVAFALIAGGTAGLTYTGYTVLDYDLDQAPAGAEQVMAEFQENLDDLKDAATASEIARYDTIIADAELSKAKILDDAGEEIEIKVYEDALLNAEKTQSSAEYDVGYRSVNIARDMFNQNSDLGEANVEIIRSALVDGGFDAGSFNLNFDAKTLSQCQDVSVDNSFDEAGKALEINQCAAAESENNEARLLLALPALGASVGMYFMLGGMTGAAASGARRRRQRKLGHN